MNCDKCDKNLIHADKREVYRVQRFGMLWLLCRPCAPITVKQRHTGHPIPLSKQKD